MTIKREISPDRLGNVQASVVVGLQQGTTATPETVESVNNKLTTVNYVWNPNTLNYEAMIQPSTGGGAGGSTSVTLTSGSTAAIIGSVTQGPGSTTIAPWYVISTASAGAGSTTVDVNTLPNVVQGAGSTSVAPWYVISTASAGAGSTQVDVVNTPNVTLSSVGSARVAARFTVDNPTTSVSVSSGVILGAGSSANTLGSVTLAAGTSANTVGSVALVAGSSANTIGAVVQGPGSTANFWFMQSIPFSSGNIARSSVSTTVDTQLIAANASRKALIIANRSTVQTVGIGFSTAALTTALANVDVFLGPSSFLSFGLQGGLPLALGPLRGINLTSTTVAGSVGVTEFT